MTTDQLERPKRGPKGVNWLRGRTLFMEGLSIAEIARQVGVSREVASRRCSAEKWREGREQIVTLASRKIEADTVRSNAETLRAHDAAAEKLLARVTKRLDELAAGAAFDANEAMQIAATLRSCATVQRAARGLTGGEGFGPAEDRVFTVNVRQLPPAPPGWFLEQRKADRAG
jgi:methylphosphotriester-DNA--protein-cysteine methyltransferase